MLPLGRSLVHRLGLKPLRFGGAIFIGRPAISVQWSSGNLVNAVRRATTSLIVLDVPSGTQKEGKQQKQEKKEQSSEVKTGKKRNRQEKKKTSNAKKQRENTPLDLFFLSFTTYKHDPSLPPAASFKRLYKHFHWKKEHEDQQNAWKRYQDALVEEVRYWYGVANDITACHALCRALGHISPPDDMKECIKASSRALLRGTHVNIVDLIHWASKGRNEDAPVRKFDSEEELANYTRSKMKIFPRQRTKNEEEQNLVLAHLLRRIQEYYWRRRGNEGEAGGNGMGALSDGDSK
ncbi:hypothetical protein PT974_04505 [Cladobotryum mycophilum]|uniref:Uncharacterized protein n=1 Tax=Cladobotryum mycophilum TaxID=491253 RepID=A0ABR0SVC4_9HYPO